MIDPEISPEDLRKAYRKVNSITFFLAQKSFKFDILYRLALAVNKIIIITSTLNIFCAFTAPINVSAQWGYVIAQF